MRKYQLVANQDQGGITVLTMRPAAPGARMEFRPGQYVALGFRRFGRKSPMRCFSLVNTPNAAGELQVAFRRQGNFTDVLAGLQVGAELFVGGPYGSFCVPSTHEYPLVYLAAGIGITPFLSLLQGQIRRGQAVPTTLLYSCRSLDDMPFAAELVEWSRKYPWLTVRFLVDQAPGAASQSPLVIPAKLTAEVLRQYADPDADYYICGPPGYNTLANSLLAAELVPLERVHTEAFGQGSGFRLAGASLPQVVYGLTTLLLLAGVGGTFVLDALTHKKVLASPVVPQNVDSSTGQQNTSTQQTTNTGTYTDPYANTAPAPPSQPYQMPMSGVS